jgi:hypothetical protein
MIAPTASPSARPPVFVVIANSSFVSKVPVLGELPADSAPNKVTKVSNAATFNMQLHQVRANRGGNLAAPHTLRPVCAVRVNKLLMDGQC